MIQVRILAKGNKNLRQGFTLIELLVVIAIIGILASVVLASLSTARKKARDTQRVADMQQIRTALELYYLDNGHYPDKTVGVTEAGEYIGTGDDIDRELRPYLDPIPKDPAHDGTVYFYSYDPWHNIELNNCPNGTVSNVGVVFGFNKAEGGGTFRKETCSGSNKNLDSADYNRAIILQ